LRARRVTPSAEEVLRPESPNPSSSPAGTARSTGGPSNSESLSSCAHFAPGLRSLHLQGLQIKSSALARISPQGCGLISLGSSNSEFLISWAGHAPRVAPQGFSTSKM
jgi:hypothetical protein